MTAFLNNQEKEALLLMFGQLWRQRYWSLDGLRGRPSLSDCIDFALRKRKQNAEEDLIDFLEDYLNDMARRCQNHAAKDRT
ncbi:MAG: hypothetical protein KC505_09010 [Myxococcales bacterium]|nr:hypothetical protein [Myxococcales bacterium]USN50114.1 MAG: hypothetical protein H6731_07530 [Myxococcales bacterium]